jgi:hypothetical protein
LQKQLIEGTTDSQPYTSLIRIETVESARIEGADVAYQDVEAYYTNHPSGGSDTTIEKDLKEALNRVRVGERPEDAEFVALFDPVVDVRHHELATAVDSVRDLDSHRVGVDDCPAEGNLRADVRPGSRGDLARVEILPKRGSETERADPDAEDDEHDEEDCNIPARTSIGESIYIGPVRLG